MKLKNKKTGEIGTLIVDGAYNFVTNFAVEDEERNRLGEYNSLAELNEEWEDYEEPKDKGYWYIDDLCRMRYSSELLDEIDDRPNNWMIRKLCGNYFDTREEAEKAVHKLQAWKRLKDDGITYSLDEGDGTPYIIIHSKEEKGPVQKVLRVLEDLTLLFGGEE